MYTTITLMDRIQNMIFVEVENTIEIKSTHC